MFTLIYVFSVSQLGVQMGIPANFIQAALSRKFTSHDAEVRVAGK